MYVYKTQTENKMKCPHFVNFSDKSIAIIIIKLSKRKVEETMMHTLD